MTRADKASFTRGYVFTNKISPLGRVLVIRFLRWSKNREGDCTSEKLTDRRTVCCCAN